MAIDCCQLVGDFNLGGSGCIISVNTSCSAETSKPCGPETILFAGAVETISISAYATTLVHVGCSGKAGVSIPWIRKYDCMADKTYFIFSGEGESYVVGTAHDIASVKYEAPQTCDAISASSSSGPQSIYMRTSQTNGYGLRYSGGPFSFDTGSAEGTTLDLGYVLGEGYLQNFSYESQPGQLPIVNYTIVRAVGG
jgi:hypothetical protein